MSAPRILHYPGSKWSVADWIISHMPPHAVYLEPYFGSGAVLFNKQPSGLETINDIDGDVINLFRIIRDQPEQLAQAVYWTPYSRLEYLEAHNYSPTETDVERARRFLVRCWQSIRVKTGSISGYAHPLYDSLLAGWLREERQQIIENGAERIEVLWINPIAAQYGQQSLF